MKTQAFQIAKLRGMDQRWRPAPNTATSIRDMTWDQRDGWRDSGGFKPLFGEDELQKGSGLFASPYAGEGVITSMHWFAQHNGARQWLIYETENRDLKALYGSDRGTVKTPYIYLERIRGKQYSPATALRTYVSSPWQRTQSQTFNGRLYMVNGYDEPLVFDGRTVERAGFDGPAAPPFASLIEKQTSIDALGIGPAGPSGEDGVGVAYRYVVTFVNDRGQESPPSPPSNLLRFANIGSSTESLRHMLAVTIPVGGDPVVARRLYRTINLVDEGGNMLEAESAENYYFLREIQDNISTYFEDGNQDHVLGSVMDAADFGTWPQSAKFLSVFKNTMFIAGMTSNEVRFSAPNMPEVFPQDNVFQIGDSDMGNVTGMYPTRNALVIFKLRGIYLIKGDPASGFYAQTLTRDIGCSAPNSVAEVPSVGLVFLSDAGIYALTGALENTGTRTDIVHLSAQIPDEIDRINKSAIVKSVGVVYHRDKEYWLAVPTLGKIRNDRILVFHYEIGAWSYRTDYPIEAAVETRDHRGYLIFGSYDTADNPGLHVYTSGAEKKGTAPGSLVNPLYETAHMDFGSVYRTVQPAYANLYVVGYGDNDIKLNFTVNRQSSRAQASASTRDQKYPMDSLSTWDTTKFDDTTSVWAHHRPIIARFDISAMHEQPVHELLLGITSAQRRIQIIGFDVEVKVGEQRQILPMSTALRTERR